jgi:rubrerythrin
MTTVIETLPQLLAHATALEREAVERYEELAGQMEVHNNPELAELFYQMAAIEQKHVDQVQLMTADVRLPPLAPWEYAWQDPEGPESVPIGFGHYRLTPHQALQQMLACEERACAFFEHVVRTSQDTAVQALAWQFAEEERHHAELLRQWLTRYPQTTAEGEEDLDEPVSQE